MESCPRQTPAITHASCRHAASAPFALLLSHIELPTSLLALTLIYGSKRVFHLLRAFVVNRRGDAAEKTGRRDHALLPTCTALRQCVPASFRRIGCRCNPAWMRGGLAGCHHYFRTVPG